MLSILFEIHRKICTFGAMKRKIYVASSWRNEYYPEVVAKLREA